MDAVPRLSPWTLGRLAKEVSECAANSGTDLDEDMQHYVERLSSIWAPRVRHGSLAIWELILVDFEGFPRSTPFLTSGGGSWAVLFKENRWYMCIYKYR